MKTKQSQQTSSRNQNRSLQPIQPRLPITQTEQPFDQETGVARKEGLLHSEKIGPMHTTPLSIQREEDPQPVPNNRTWSYLPYDNPNLESSESVYELTGFATDSATLTNTHQIILQQLAQELNERPLTLGGFVTIWGFADSRGREGHNRQLGQRRADVAKTYLEQQVNDAETRRNIRAYSMGEGMVERQGDIPEERKVEITITRREFQSGILSPGGLRNPTAPPQTRFQPRIGPDPGFRVPLTGFPQRGPVRQSIPPWLLRNITPYQRSPITLRRLSEVLTDGLRQPIAGGTAPLARRLAGIVGINASEEEIRRSLDDAMISGGEAALKALLKMMITSIAGQPTPQLVDPFGATSPPFSGPLAPPYKAPGETMFQLTFPFDLF